VATIQNRSSFVVSSSRKLEVRRTFPFNKVKQAAEYLTTLKAEYPKARIEQLEDTIFVRIRNRGHANIETTLGSYEAAEDFVSFVEAERRQGTVVDYGKLLKTTMADLIVKYIDKELPRQKGGEQYEYVFRAMLEDSEGALESQIAQRERELKETGQSSIEITATRTPMGCLEWMRKPFAQVTAADIEDWMRSREGDVVPANHLATVRDAARRHQPGHPFRAGCPRSQATRTPASRFRR